MSAISNTQSHAARDGVTHLAPSWLLGFESLLGKAMETVLALLLVTEVGVLFAGILGRISGHPLTWSDELSSVLFIWLAMIGAAVATQRHGHMRMTALVQAVRPGFRSLLEAFALAVVLAFVVAVLPSAYEYASEERYIRTPALNLANSWRAAALPVGLALMLFMGSMQLLRVATSVRYLLAAAAILAVFALLGFLARSMLVQMGNYNLVIFFVGVLFLCVLAGVPIAFSFGLATLTYLVFCTALPISVLVGRMDEGMSHLILLAVPLFVFLGLLIEITGMAKTMVDFLASLLGHIKGGMSFALIGAMYLVSGISGSKAADIAAIAPVLLPEMEKRGAKRGDMVALLSAAGAQTETIPPSLVLIILGSTTGVSIATLFTAGLLPAFVLGCFLAAMVWWRYRHEDLSSVRRYTQKEIGVAFLIAVPALLLPFIIRAAVMEGVATATEVSTIGVLYAFLIGVLLYRNFPWSRLYPVLVDTGVLSGAILVIIGTATAMAYALTQSGFSTTLAAAMASLPGGAPMFMCISIIAFILLGSILEGIPAIVLFGPLLFPIARQFGIHEVHYSMVVVLSMGIGLFAPPLGVGYYIACAVAEVDPNEGVRPIMGYLFALFIGVVIVALFPWISIGFLKT